MAGLCKITLVGNLLNEPRSSQTNSGIPLTRFQLQVEREVRASNQNMPETVFDVYSVAVFGQGGADLERRFRAGEFAPGSRLLVMGRFELRESSDGQGQQPALEVTADDVFDLGPDSAGVIHSLLGGNAPCRVVIAGNMGGDPEVRQVPSGSTVVNFSIAVSRPVPRQAQQRDENTNWFRVAGWNTVADRMMKLADMGALAKGRKLLVEGVFVPREWQDNSGQRRISLDVTARDFELLGDPPGGLDVSGERRGGMNRGGDRDSFGDEFGGAGRGGGGYSGGARTNDNFGNRGGGGRRDEDFGNQDVDDIPF